SNYALLVVSGTMEKVEDEIRIRVRSVAPAAEIRTRYIRAVRIDLPAERADEPLLLRMRDLLKQHPGQAKVYFYLSEQGNGTTISRAGDGFGIAPAPLLVESLRGLLSQDAVRFDVATSGNGASPFNGGNGRPDLPEEVEALERQVEEAERAQMMW